MSSELDGKIALVAASSRGLGRAIAATLGKEGARFVRVMGVPSDKVDVVGAKRRHMRANRTPPFRLEVGRSDDLVAVDRIAYRPADENVIERRSRVIHRQDLHQVLRTGDDLE